MFPAGLVIEGVCSSQTNLRALQQHGLRSSIYTDTVGVSLGRSLNEANSMYR